MPDDPGAFKKKGALFVMADGLGGMARGEEASRLAVEEMERLFADVSQMSAASWLLRSIRAVNRRIYALNQKEAREHWMATTLTCSHFKGTELTVGHVGDSRIYRVRDRELLCLTQDHSVDRHTLTRAVGTDPELLVDVYEFGLEEDDIYIQCSDGLYAVVHERDLWQTAVGFTPQESCDRLVALANQGGGTDNISVQVLRVERALAGPP